MFEKKNTVKKDSQFTQETNLAYLLNQTLMTLDEAGKEFSDEHTKLELLAERLTNELLNLAVLGQFKRGKSTFINALLGKELLPSAVIPLTAIPTFLHWGLKLSVTIFYQHGKPSDTHNNLSAEDFHSLLSQMVTEQGNPHNKKKISHVEILCPSSFLAKGVVLIDTPGIGSTLLHNTETTLDFLSQCDAALFIVSADPPITEVELDFLKIVRNNVGRIFFIVNKTDYLDDRQREAYLKFFRQVLHEKAGFSGEATIFCVSSKQGLNATLSSDNTLLRKSGIDRVKSFLLDFIDKEKSEVLQGAIASKTSDIIAEVQMRLEMIINSMQMPLSKLDNSLQIFAIKIKEAEQQRIVAGDLLAGDRKRLVSYLEEQAKGLRNKSRAHLLGIVENNLGQFGDSLKDDQLIKEVAKEIPVFFEGELKAMAEAF